MPTPRNAGEAWGILLSSGPGAIASTKPAGIAKRSSATANTMTLLSSPACTAGPSGVAALDIVRYQPIRDGAVAPVRRQAGTRCVSRSEQQVALRAQSPPQCRQRLLLRRFGQVDQHVSAQHNVEPSLGRNG